jgi:hypothetical protein
MGQTAQLDPDQVSPRLTRFQSFCLKGLLVLINSINGILNFIGFQERLIAPANHLRLGKPIDIYWRMQ